MPRKKTNEWPIIKETAKRKRAGEKGEKSREFTIQDARNTWKIRAVIAEIIRFEIEGFSKFYFQYDGKELTCRKVFIARRSDTGIVADTDGKLNLINDEGNRVTVRIRSLKQYIKELFK